ncbi:MAG: ABC transporter ATP-binding protein [Candidatus Hodarchaeales archaeon]
MISCDDVFKLYINRTARIEVPVLRGIDLSVNEGEFISIKGASGSGKTTLLKIICGIELPTAGKVFIKDHLISAMSLRQRMTFLRVNIGFMFQNPAINLFYGLDCLSNLTLSLKIAGNKLNSNLKQRSKKTLEFLGLEECSEKKVNNLSRGEAQRLALGMLIINRFQLLLLDEPTGSIDKANSDLIIEKLKTLANEQNRTIIMVTHNDEIAKKSEKILYMNNGRISCFQIIDQKEKEQVRLPKSVFISDDGDMVLPGHLHEKIVSRFFSCVAKQDEIHLCNIEPANLSKSNNSVILLVGKRGEISIPKNILRESGITNTAEIRIEDRNIVLSCQ